MFGIWLIVTILASFKTASSLTELLKAVLRGQDTTSASKKLGVCICVLTLSIAAAVYLLTLIS